MKRPAMARRNTGLNRLQRLKSPLSELLFGRADARPSEGSLSKTRRSETSLALGIMSGTSGDGVDVALVRGAGGLPEISGAAVADRFDRLAWADGVSSGCAHFVLRAGCGFDAADWRAFLDRGAHGDYYRGGFSACGYGCGRPGCTAGAVCRLFALSRRAGGARGAQYRRDCECDSDSSD